MLVRKESRIRHISESTSSPDSVELGGYKWIKIGELKGYPLYLCDKIIKRMPFNKSARSNDWKESDIRYWLNSDFYSNLTPEEKSQIVPFEGDKLFLLSFSECLRFEDSIPEVYHNWWLRSKGEYSQLALFIDPRDNINFTYGTDVRSNFGVRPAFLLNDKT